MKESYNNRGLIAKQPYRLLTAGLTAILMALSLQGYSQDLARIGERSIIGTARYVGMSGAMSAIGGDPTAAHDNVAGLGLYRHTEVLASIGYPSIFPQASVVLSIPHNTISDEGVQYNNFMFSYRQLNGYARTADADGGIGYSLGKLIDDYGVGMDVDLCKDADNRSNSMWLRQIGYVNEYAFNWGINISNKWYVGAGIQVQSYRISDDAYYTETFDTQNADGVNFSNENSTSLILSGVGCSFSTGLIYRPLSWLRLGVGMQTHSIGSLSTYTTGTFYAQTDSLRASYAPDLGSRDGRERIMPLHLSTSVAFQIGAYGLIALQYDYFHQFNSTPQHSLRAGFEVIPVMGLYINAGYACESPFLKNDPVVPMDPTFDRQDTYYQYPKISHYASVAVGYRGYYMLVQAAYQYRWQQLNLYAHECATPYELSATTHRVVLTIGWHRY